MTFARRTVLCAVCAMVLWLAALPLPHARVYADTSLRVTREQVMLVPVPVHHVFQVIEVLDVVNPKAVDSDVAVYLPTGYSDLALNGKPAAQPKNGVAMMAKVAKAGRTSTVSVSYTLPFNADSTAQFTLHTPYDIDTAELYLPISGYALTAENLLTTTQTTELQGTQVRVFTRLGIPAGDDWTISLQQLPAVTGEDASTAGLSVIGQPLTQQQNLVQAGANLLMACVVLAVGMAGIRSTQGVAFRRSASREEALVKALENLEFQREAGGIDEVSYVRSKAEVLRRLVKLSSQPHSGRGTDSP
jgi:hypothetical protein